MNKDKLREVCKLGQGPETCRYLGTGPKGLECLKNSPLQRTIDARVTAGNFNALGDNCEGEVS